MLLVTQYYHTLDLPWTLRPRKNSNKDFYNSIAEFCHDFEVYYCTHWLLMKTPVCHNIHTHMHLSVRVCKHMSVCVSRLKVYCTYFCVCVCICPTVPVCILSLVYFGVIFDKPLSDVARWSDSLSESGSWGSHCVGGPQRPCTGYN